MQRQRNGATENCTRPVGEAFSLPKRMQLSGSMNGSSFPTQTVGADSIRPYRAYTLIRVLAKTGVTGGFYPPLQGVCAHPGAS